MRTHPYLFSSTVQSEQLQLANQHAHCAQGPRSGTWSASVARSPVAGVPRETADATRQSVKVISGGGVRQIRHIPTIFHHSKFHLGKSGYIYYTCTSTTVAPCSS